MSEPAPNTITSLPNLLSLSRLPLGGAFWVALGPTPTLTRALSAIGVMAVAAGTDVLDGTIARRRGVSTAGMGSWLDPICDKLFRGRGAGGAALPAGAFRCRCWR
jgi:phosphatidylglycerophosphate synthase